MCTIVNKKVHFILFNLILKFYFRGIILIIYMIYIIYNINWIFTINCIYINVTIEILRIILNYSQIRFIESKDPFIAFRLKTQNSTDSSIPDRLFDFIL